MFSSADMHHVGLCRLRIKDSGDASHFDRLVSYVGSIDAMIGEKSPKVRRGGGPSDCTAKDWHKPAGLVAELKVEKRAVVGRQVKREENTLEIKLCDSDRAERWEAMRQVCLPLCSR